MNLYHKLIKLIFLFGLYFTILSQNHDCEYELKDGNKYNFSKLRKLTGDYEYVYGRYTYKANFCGPLNTKCVTSPNTPAGLFLRGNLSYQLGTSCITRYAPEWKPTVDYMDSLLKIQGLKLTFTEGEKCYLGNGNYQLTYLLKCDPNQEIKFDTVWKINTCHMEYSFFTKYACVHFAYKSSFSIFSGSSDSMFSSKNFVFTLLIIFILYTIGFTYLNYKKNPEDGLIKSLPHRSFWSNLFNNAIFGCEITLNFIKSKLFGSNENRDYL